MELLDIKIYFKDSENIINFKDIPTTDYAKYDGFLIIDKNKKSYFYNLDTIDVFIITHKETEGKNGSC